MSLVNNKGFTLIELLVVVLIIGILAAIALPQYELSVEKTRASQALVALRSLKDSMERERLARGQYPTVIEDIDITVPANQYWTFSISTDFSIFAIRKANTGGFNKNYLIAYRFDGIRHRLICRSSEDIEYGEKICKAIGATTNDGGTFPYQNWILSE